MCTLLFGVKSSINGYPHCWYIISGWQSSIHVSLKAFVYNNLEEGILSEGFSQSFVGFKMRCVLCMRCGGRKNDWSIRIYIES